jgi:hypothetical protein
MAYYKVFNVAQPTIAAPAAVATGTTIKTMLQLTSPTKNLQVVSWGYTISALPGGIGVFELIQTDVAATVTAHVASGIVGLDPNGSTPTLTVGSVTGTGYTASAEGTVTATRLFDVDQIPTASGLVPINYDYQFVPDERPVCAAGKFLRVRVTTPTSGTNMLCWVTVNEI